VRGVTPAITWCTKRLALERQRDRHAPVRGAVLRAHTLPGGVAGAVFQRRAQHLVARLQHQRARHDVDAGGGVGHEHQVLGLCADEAGQLAPRRAQQRAERRPRKSTGLRSICRCQSCSAAVTARGQAP
jgi:hypothetical protein